MTRHHTSSYCPPPSTFENLHLVLKFQRPDQREVAPRLLSSAPNLPVEKLDPVLHLLLHHPKHLHRTTTTINWPQSQAQNRRGKHIHTNKEHENSRKRRLVAASNNLRMNDWYPRSCKLEAREATSQVSFHRLISFKFWNWMHGVEYQYSV